MNIGLNRLSIIGKIEENTPDVVIREIIDAHQLNHKGDINQKNEREKMVQVIQRNTPRIVSKQTESEQFYTDEEYINIGKFINSNVVWSQEKLDIAFEFLKKFMSPDVLQTSNIPQNFEIGLQTPASPFSLNSNLLYKLCREFEYPTSASTTIQQMGRIIKYMLEPYDLLKEHFLSKFDKISKKKLIHFYNLIEDLDLIEDQKEEKEEKNEKEENEKNENNHFYDIMNTLENLRSEIKMFRRIEPINKEEAITIAAMKYRIDISWAEDPRREFVNLSRSVEEVNNEEDKLNLIRYIPTDPKIAYYFRENNIFLRLDLEFNPIFPVQCYSDEGLRKFAYDEGYDDSDLYQYHSYELLSLSHLMLTFHPGKYPTNINEETPITMETIIEIPNEMIVSYGIKSGETTAYKYSELADAFSYSHNFENPNSRDIFEKIAINKLKILSQRRTNYDTVESINDKTRLLNIIEHIELMIDKNNEQLLSLYNIYSNSDFKLKKKIEDCFDALFNLTMYMRGWNGVKEHPIMDAPVDNYYEVEVRVTDGIHLFEKKCEDLREIGTKILNLPLYQKDSNQRITVSSSETDGKTLGSRLIIVKSGEDTSSISSCIRLSSNFFGISLHRYLKTLQLPERFKMEDFAHIY